MAQSHVVGATGLAVEAVARTEHVNMLSSHKNNFALFWDILPLCNRQPENVVKYELLVFILPCFWFEPMALYGRTTPSSFWMTLDTVGARERERHKKTNTSLPRVLGRRVGNQDDVFA